MIFPVPMRKWQTEAQFGFSMGFEDVTARFPSLARNPQSVAVADWFELLEGLGCGQWI
jgi:hypothetical protein